MFGNNRSIYENNAFAFEAIFSSTKGISSEDVMKANIEQFIFIVSRSVNHACDYSRMLAISTVLEIVSRYWTFPAPNLTELLKIFPRRSLILLYNHRYYRILTI